MLAELDGKVMRPSLGAFALGGAAFLLLPIALGASHPVAVTLSFWSGGRCSRCPGSQRRSSCSSSAPRAHDGSNAAIAGRFASPSFRSDWRSASSRWGWSLGPASSSRQPAQRPRSPARGPPFDGRRGATPSETPSSARSGRLPSAGRCIPSNRRRRAFRICPPETRRACSRMRERPRPTARDGARRGHRACSCPPRPRTTSSAGGWSRRWRASSGASPSPWPRGVSCGGCRDARDGTCRVRGRRWYDAGSHAEATHAPRARDVSIHSQSGVLPPDAPGRFQGVGAVLPSTDR